LPPASARKSIAVANKLARSGRRRLSSPAGTSALGVLVGREVAGAASKPIQP
jgi:hypothetical protein